MKSRRRIGLPRLGTRNVRLQTQAMKTGNREQRNGAVGQFTAEDGIGLLGAPWKRTSRVSLCATGNVDKAAPPASTTIGVPQLARPGALFEVEAISILLPK